MKKFTEKEYDDPDLNQQKSRIGALKKGLRREATIALEEKYNEFIGARK